MDTTPGTKPEESILDIAQRAVDMAKADPRIRATAERSVEEIRTSLGRTIVLDAANDTGLGPKASPDAKSLMAHVRNEQKEREKEGYSREQAINIVIKDLQHVRTAAVMANDNDMLAGIRHVSAVLTNELGKQPDGPEKGTDIGKFTGAAKRGTAFAMRGRGGRT